jgi:hypothetical protein
MNTTNEGRKKRELLEERAKFTAWFYSELELMSGRGLKDLAVAFKNSMNLMWLAWKAAKGVEE